MKKSWNKTLDEKEDWEGKDRIPETMMHVKASIKYMHIPWW